jgi:hypothetical protein
MCTCFVSQTSCLDANSILGQLHSVDMDSVVEDMNCRHFQVRIKCAGCVTFCVRLFLSLYFSCFSHLENRASVKRFVSLQCLNPEARGSVVG